MSAYTQPCLYIQPCAAGPYRHSRGPGVAAGQRSRAGQRGRRLQAAAVGHAHQQRARSRAGEGARRERPALRGLELPGAAPPGHRRATADHLLAAIVPQASCGLLYILRAFRHDIVLLLAGNYLQDL